MTQKDKSHLLHFLQKSIFPVLLLWGMYANAQNPKIKCYFNHPVNTMLSTGINAVYLNGSFDDSIAAYINRAKYSVDIAQYDYTSTASSIVAKIATAANNAYARGVVVRWIYNGSSTNSGLSLLNAGISRLASPTSSGYNIMHNKFMVIDVNSTDSTDAYLNTSSYDWSSTQTTGDFNNMVMIQSKSVAMAYYNEFNKMWGGTAATPNTTTSTFGPHKTPSAQHFFNVNGTPVEVYFCPKDTVGLRLKNSINTANHDLFFGIYTFTDTSIANLIKSKYNNGLYVRGIIDSYSQTYAAYPILNTALGSNMILHTGSYIYHNKIMLVDAQQPASDPQVFTGSFNWSATAQTTNDENAIVIHDSSIANQYYQSLCQDYTNMGGIPCSAPPCANDTTLLTSNLKGTTYQWQVNTGAGFVNISNNTNYTGSTALNLFINNAPSNWYGYQYRCLVDGTNYSTTIALKFTAYWNGSVSNAWENPLNWNCGIVPDGYTDVIINNGPPNAPVVNSISSCRSVSARPGTSITVKPGALLLLTGY